jgi:transcriptional regulator with XRE-family HTH domain
MKKQMPGVDSVAERAAFARNLRLARLNLHMRQRDLHLLTGIAQAQISQIEDGQCNMSIDTMVKLSTVVKVPLWRLFKPGGVEGSDENLSEPLPDARRGPRARDWHEERLQAVAFDFSDAELRQIRKAAADAGVSVIDFLRSLLRKERVLS